MFVLLDVHVLSLSYRWETRYIDIKINTPSGRQSLRMFSDLMPFLLPASTP